MCAGLTCAQIKFHNCIMTSTVLEVPHFLPHTTGITVRNAYIVCTPLVFDAQLRHTRHTRHTTFTEGSSCSCSGSRGSGRSLSICELHVRT